MKPFDVAPAPALHGVAAPRWHGGQRARYVVVNGDLAQIRWRVVTHRRRSGGARVLVRKVAPPGLDGRRRPRRCADGAAQRPTQPRRIRRPFPPRCTAAAHRYCSAAVVRANPGVLRDFTYDAEYANCHRCLETLDEVLASPRRWAPTPSGTRSWASGRAGATRWRRICHRAASWRSPRTV